MDSTNYNTWLDSTPLDFKKKLIGEFIANTITYARSHIASRQNEIGAARPEQLEEKCIRLTRWTGYVEFQEHTLEELRGNKIDNLIP